MMDSRPRPAHQRVHIRETRDGRVLKIDGTLASCYRRGQAMTGGLWDGLVAPLAPLAPARVRSVLILGLGGGSAARAIRALFPQAEIVGVDSDLRVIRAARRWFGLDSLRLEVAHVDARRFLETDRRRFDVVLDDVFLAWKGEAWKPDWLPRPGLALAAAHLSAGGVLVSNTIDETAAFVRVYRSLFSRALTLRLRDYENGIVVGGLGDLSARALRARIAARSLLRPVLPDLSVRAAG